MIDFLIEAIVFLLGIIIFAIGIRFFLLPSIRNPKTGFNIGKLIFERIGLLLVIVGVIWVIGTIINWFD